MSYNYYYVLMSRYGEGKDKSKSSSDKSLTTTGTFSKNVIVPGLTFDGQVNNYNTT